ncbi:MAG: translation initiation factor IF-2 subunit alpha [Thermoproteota archaeon]
MSIPQRKELPDVGELVVGTVKEVYDYGAYLTLDEYGGLEAYLPWSEVASRWVRSIHDVVKVGHKIVVKVIRVNKKTKEVDVSLKRVTENERKRKMIEWKRAQKAYKILELVSEKSGVDLQELVRNVAEPLVERYGELMAAFEEAAIRGEEVFKGINADEKLLSALLEEIRRHIEVKRVRISGIITARSYAGDGVSRVRKVLETVKQVLTKSQGVVGVKLYTVGAPRYKLEVEAHDYQTLEKAIGTAIKAGEEAARELGVIFNFEREKR